MKKLFSPWRSKYIETFADGGKNDKGCTFCKAAEADRDDANFIIKREAKCFAIMNLYPYNSGHLMIVPYRHVPTLLDLSDEETAGIMLLLKKTTLALQSVSKPDGFNIGANIGRSAGAGIDTHVHFHLVPRWNGDTNFMPVLTDTKLISEDMKEMLVKLRGALSK